MTMKRITNRSVRLSITLVSAALLSACSPSAPADGGGATGPSSPGSPPAADRASVADVTADPATSWWSDAPLEGAVDVVDVRASGKDGERVVLRGTLQDFGSSATFRLVEDSLKDCSEKADDRCPTPWDYCCEDPAKLRELTVNVEFLDGEFPGEWTLDGEHGLDHLSEVAVAGVLRVDEQGNLRLEAERMALQQ